MKTAIYKGRKYRLIWSGTTKFGTRAHLKFFDGTKDFWVPAGSVMVVNQPRKPVLRRGGGGWPTCDGCGYSGREVDGDDAICPQCGNLVDP